MRKTTYTFCGSRLHKAYKRNVQDLGDTAYNPLASRFHFEPKLSSFFLKKIMREHILSHPDKASLAGDAFYV